MKNTRPRSLRTKMTLLSGGIIFAIAAGLTFASIFSAGRLFVTLPGTVISHTEPVIIQGSIEPAEAAEVRGEALPGVQIGSFLVEESPEGPARELADRTAKTAGRRHGRRKRGRTAGRGDQRGGG